MRVTVVFVRVVTKPEYDHGSRRWLESYWRYEAGYKHNLIIIERYADSTDGMFGIVPCDYMRYDGGGWDCGAWQFAGKNIDTDLLVCFNSSTYITGHYWLRRFVEAVEKHGDGLYGPLTSNEIIPHVRTPCMIFQPHIINDYPATVNSREDTYRFESLGFPDGTPNFTQWVKGNGSQTMLVTWYGVYDMEHWRDPANIFRKGNQQSLVVKDRHCDAYEVSDAPNKIFLEGLAGYGDPVRKAQIDKFLFNVRET